MSDHSGFDWLSNVTKAWRMMITSKRVDVFGHEEVKGGLRAVCRVSSFE